VENVSFSGMDLQEVRSASGLEFDPIEIDALAFSPCSRKRYFITNIPLLNNYLSYEPYFKNDDHIAPETCLDEG